MSLSDALSNLFGRVKPSEPLDPNTQRVVLTANDYRVQGLESYADRPARVRQTVKLTGLAAFVAYVNRYKDAASTLFVAPNLSALSKGVAFATAILDYHQTSDESPMPVAAGAIQPRWGSHVAVLLASPSIAYAKLMELDGKLLGQDDFARKLEELGRFCTSMAQADLLEMARTLVLTSKGDFKSFDDEFSGSVDFVYDVQVRANAGSAQRKLSVPQELTFTCPLVDGMPETAVPVRFLYRIPAEAGGKVQLGIRIIDRTWLEQAAIDGVREHLSAATGLAVYTGELGAAKDA